MSKALTFTEIVEMCTSNGLEIDFLEDGTLCVVDSDDPDARIHRCKTENEVREIVGAFSTIKRYRDSHE